MTIDEAGGGNDPRRHRGSCPSCGQRFPYTRYHAGFSNLGHLYCDREETVLTWDSYSPTYSLLVSDKHPWMLDAVEQKLVEDALQPCPCDGHFRFSNPPVCPHCHHSVAALLPGSIYILIAGRRIDADTAAMWTIHA